MASKKEPLSVTHPELAAQADGWDPTTLAAGAAMIVSWECGRGHSWKDSVSHRSSGRGCPVCSNKQVLVGYNDLATTHPELAAQAEGWDPTTLIAGSGTSVDWKCKHGHKWSATLKDRSQGDGCPVCSNKRVLVGYNDLATTHPELAAQAEGWDPTLVVKFSHKKFKWRCEQGHIWITTVASRSSGRGCPVCSGRQVLIGYNDLATTNPELAAQADGWDPTTVNAGSDKRVGWKCKHGHKWNAVVSSRAGNARGCPVCSGRQVLGGYNDLATMNPELAVEADGWDPTTVLAGSHKKLGWKCKHGHKWNAVVESRARGLGCPFCAGKAVLAGFNDLATTNPELAAQADGWDPTTLTAGSSVRKVQWRCTQGHTWKSLIRDRSRGVGCPSCASGGFDPNQIGWLYLIDHDALAMFQVGISNIPKRRLDEHSKRGWEVLEVRGPMDGHLAQQLETAILRAVERRGAVLGHKAQIEKFDGYSEAWTKDSLSVTSFKQLLDWVYEDDH